MTFDTNIGNSIGKLEEKDFENKIKVIKEGSKIVIIISIPHMIEITDEESKEVEIIRLLKLTDLLGKKLYSIHHQCILHAERRANELMREYLPGNENKGYRDIIKPLLRKVFSAKDEQGLEEEYRELMSKEEGLPEASKSIFSLIRRFYPKLHRCIVEVGIPKTTNACENAIKGFNLKYQNTFGYSNIYAIRDFLKLYTI